MPEKITNFTEYIAGAFGVVFSLIAGLVGVIVNGLIDRQKKSEENISRLDNRVDMAETHIATNARDLELLRKEHDRELERCHGKNKNQ